MDYIFNFITFYISVLIGIFVGNILYQLLKNRVEKKLGITNEDVLRYIKENEEVYYRARMKAILDMLGIFARCILTVLWIWIAYHMIKLLP